IHPLSTYIPLFSPSILIPYLYLKHIDPHLPLPHPKHIFSLHIHPSLPLPYPHLLQPPLSPYSPLLSMFLFIMFLSTMPFLSLQHSPLYSLFPSPSLPTLMSPSSSSPPPSSYSYPLFSTSTPLPISPTPTPILPFPIPPTPTPIFPFLISLTPTPPSSPSPTPHTHPIFPFPISPFPISPTPTLMFQPHTHIPFPILITPTPIPMSPSSPP